MATVHPISFPLEVGEDGHCRRTTPDAALSQLIEQLLFTNPGERLNHPELGCGLIERVFDAAGEELRAATEFQIQTALQRDLGGLVKVGAVSVAAEMGTLAVTVSYQAVSTRSWQTVVFHR